MQPKFDVFYCSHNVGRLRFLGAYIRYRLIPELDSVRSPPCLKHQKWLAAHQSKGRYEAFVCYQLQIFVHVTGMTSVVYGFEPVICHRSRNLLCYMRRPIHMYWTRRTRLLREHHVCDLNCPSGNPAGRLSVQVFPGAPNAKQSLVGARNPRTKGRALSVAPITILWSTPQGCRSALAITHLRFLSLSILMPREPAFLSSQLGCLRRFTGPYALVSQLAPQGTLSSRFPRVSRITGRVSRSPPQLSQALALLAVLALPLASPPWRWPHFRIVPLICVI